MPLRSTYTYVTLGVSRAVFEEIWGKLRAAEYWHAFEFHKDQDEPYLIDMHGIALIVEGE
jgi:hypothetical protein